MSFLYSYTNVLTQSIVGAAAAATSLSALYLNAKYGVSQDMRLIRAQNRALREVTEAGSPLRYLHQS